jgi:xanthine phosphoribosyltransferase
LPESHVATVYAKPGGMPYVDTFVHEVAQAVWIFFTWDTDLAYTTPMMARKNPIPTPR